MSFRNKRLLFYFDQFFSVPLGEGTYVYDPSKQNISILRALVALTKALICLPSNEKKYKIKGDKIRDRHLFYLETINQKNALSVLLTRVEHPGVWLVLNEQLNRTDLRINGIQYYSYLPVRRIYLHAIALLPRAIMVGTLMKRRYRGRYLTAHLYINMALFFSVANYWEHLLEIERPASVTVVNDHNLFPLALMLAARRCNVPSIYIQHASVSAVFPKLLADVALLEGLHSMETYNKIGVMSKKVSLVGIPRLDGVLGYKRAPIASKVVVGICSKAFYTENQIQQLIENASKATRTSKIIVRPHPGSPESHFLDIKKLNGVDISDPRSVDSIAFLKCVDVVISAESTILLEATLMRIPAIHFDDESFFFPYDLYGYVRNNVAYRAIKNANEIPDLLDHLDWQKVNECFMNCRYYCATIGTPLENKSTELIVNYYKNSQWKD